MAHHLDLASAAERLSLAESELREFCFRHSVPILHGRVDVTLVRAVMAEATRAAAREITARGH